MFTASPFVVYGQGTLQMDCPDVGVDLSNHCQNPMVNLLTVFVPGAPPILSLHLSSVLKLLQYTMAPPPAQLASSCPRDLMSCYSHTVPNKKHAILSMSDEMRSG